MTNNFHFKNIPVHTVHVNWVNFLKQQADIPCAGTMICKSQLPLKRYPRTFQRCLKQARMSQHL